MRSVVYHCRHFVTSRDQQKKLSTSLLRSMSFVSDELANVLKSVYMKEDSGKDEDANSSSNLDKKNGEVVKEKRSRKRKHKKHSSKSKSRDKKKHKKRKHKSRSRSRSESRSRSRSRSSERDHFSKPSKRRSISSNSRSKSPEEIDHDDFILEKEKTLDGESKGDKSDKEENDLKTKEDEKTVSSLDIDLKKKPEETSESESKTLVGKEQGSIVQSSDDKLVNLDAHSPADEKEKDRSRSRSQSHEKVSGSKGKKSDSRSQSISKSPDNKSSRQSRSHSRECKIKKKSRSSSKESLDRKKSRSRSRSRNKRKSRSRSRSGPKELSHRKNSRSRSRSRNRSKPRKSKSRSRSKARNRKRSVSKSRSRSRSHSKSRSPRHKRSRSRSRKKSPAFRNFRRYSPPPRWKRGRGSFRQRSRSISRSRRSRSRRRSHSRRRHSRSRSNSRSKSRLRNGRRSRSRSGGRRSRSRSRSRLQNRRSQSVSKGRRRRSRSRSRSRRKERRSTSRDRNRSKSKSKSRSKSKSKEKTQTSGTLPVPNTSTAVVNKVTSVPDKPVVTTLSSQQIKVAQRAGGKTIAELTAFCKKLQEEKGGAEYGEGEETKTVEEDSQPVAHHPFLVKEKPDITIPPVIFPVNMNKSTISTVDPNKPLQEQFPVSCGSKHREKEVDDDGAVIVADVDGSATQTQQTNEVFAPPPTEKFDISELVAKRMDAQRRLQTDPNDIEALLILQEIQMKMQNWCQSNVKPGQFTGELVKNLLPKEDLRGGFQAWAKKDMFHNLAPVTGGIGMKLLQKMGWKPGQVIGKRGEGHAEPIALTVKIDRKGLSAGKEKAAKKGTPAMLDLQGKHPVSALAEYCSKRKWQLPDYSLIFDHGPAHHKQFLFKVLVNDMEYQPAVVCGNKKQAKAQAAMFALKGLGLIPEDADMSAL